MTEGVQKSDTGEFLGQLDTLGRLYVELLDLTRAQCESADAYEGVSVFLERKQALMREVDAVGLDFASLRERWAEAREALPEEQRAGVGEKIKTIQSTLREVIEMENRWQEKVSARKEETLDQIRKLQGGRKIARAYGNPPRESGRRFLDKTE